MMKIELIWEMIKKIKVSYEHENKKESKSWFIERKIAEEVDKINV
jgi:hypothetical protein